MVVGSFAVCYLAVLLPYFRQSAGPDGGSAQLHGLKQSGGHLTVAVDSLDAPRHPARVGGPDDHGLGHPSFLRVLGEGSQGGVDGTASLDHPLSMQRLLQAFQQVSAEALGFAVRGGDIDPQVATDGSQVSFGSADETAPQATDQPVEVVLEEQGLGNIMEHPLDHAHGDAKLLAVLGQATQCLLHRTAGVFGALESPRVHRPLLDDGLTGACAEEFGPRSAIHPQVHAEVVEMSLGAELDLAGGFGVFHYTLFLTEVVCYLDLV